MGYSLSWLATKGKSPQAVLQELGFQGTGKRQQFTASDLSAAGLGNSWYLIVAEHSDNVAPDSILERLTSGCEAVTCFVEEHVMVSQAAGWKNGQKVWSIIHDCQIDPDHLEVQGKPPLAFAGIRERLWAKKEKERGGKFDCDFIFDIPVETARELTGYRHDQTTDHIFEVLTRPQSLLSGTDSLEANGRRQGQEGKN
jgi:hypothetical protein